MPSWILPSWFLIAAIWALSGTNAQAAMAREDWYEDDDPLIAEGGRLWLPAPWLAGKRRRKRVAEIEAELRHDADRWKRYRRLKRDLRAWNALESSVALAAAASLGALIAAIR
jgi:hypothetical protein